LTSRFDNVSFDGIIFGIYLFKNNRVGNPSFELPSSIDFGFTCQALSWDVVGYVNDEGLIEAGYEPVKEPFFTTILELFADINKNVDSARAAGSKVVPKPNLIALK
jgi:hypothetical protein